jgi:hypothetical protein
MALNEDARREWEFWRQDLYDRENALGKNLPKQKPRTVMGRRIAETERLVKELEQKQASDDD